MDEGKRAECIRRSEKGGASALDGVKSGVECVAWLGKGDPVPWTVGKGGSSALDVRKGERVRQINEKGKGVKIEMEERGLCKVVEFLGSLGTREIETQSWGTSR